MDTKLSKIHQRLVNDPSYAVMFYPDGAIRDDGIEVLNPYNVQVVPGSFNPLHEGHKCIHDSAIQSVGARLDGAYVLFESSIRRWDKPPLSFDDFTRLVDRFHWKYVLLVTNAPTFLEKCYILRDCRSITYHIGYDSADRLLASCGLGVGVIPADFVVYSRDNESLTGLSKKFQIPENMVEGKKVREVPYGLSSTQIRNNTVSRVSGQ